MHVAGERRRAGGLHEPDDPQPLRVLVAAERRRAEGAYEPDVAQPQRVLVAATRITTTV